MTQQINYDDVSIFLIELVAGKTDLEIDHIKLSDALNDLNLDSLDVLDLTFEAEHKFKISFPRELGSISTLKDVVDLTYNLITNKNNNL
jgi:acyl carrier protein